MNWPKKDTQQRHHTYQAIYSLPLCSVLQPHLAARPSMRASPKLLINNLHPLKLWVGKIGLRDHPWQKPLPLWPIHFYLSDSHSHLIGSNKCGPVSTNPSLSSTRCRTMKVLRATCLSNLTQWPRQAIVQWFRGWTRHTCSVDCIKMVRSACYTKHKWSKLSTSKMLISARLSLRSIMTQLQNKH